MAQVIAEFHSLDSAAKANLSSGGYAAFERRRDDLKARGTPWEEAETILTGFIWDESEGE